MFFWHRWRAHARINSAFRLWYHRDYAAPDIPPGRRIAHMQTDRAEQVLVRLAQLGLITPGQVASPSLAELVDLERVHPHSYLAQTTEPEVLARIFGVPVEDIEVDALVGAQRRAVGGTVAAALAVVLGHVRVGFNLGGGFHHAAPQHGAGFCVLNDIAVAIALLRARGYAAPIAIVDLDYHQGDGNIAAFAEDPTVLIYSIHGAPWTTDTPPNSRNYTLKPGANDHEYLALLDETLRPTLNAHGTKLVFYVAGADVLAGDQLGDFSLTPEGVLARDRRVIAAADFVHAPVVVTMAGGYGPGAWQCTANFIRWLLTGVTRPDRSPAEKLRYRFAKVSRRIDAWEWQRDDDLIIREEDLCLERAHRPRHLILGYFSAAGIEMAFQRFGVLDKMRAQGFVDLRVVVSPDDPMAQVVRVEGASVASPDTSHLLIELVLSRRSLVAPDLLGEPKLGVLCIEWLLMQDPTRPFSPTLPRLPGQEHPGLGLAHEVHQLLVEMAKRVCLDGLLNRPAHYHNAVLAGREYRFLDAEAEGSFRALRRALASVTLAEATHRVDRGDLVYGDGARFQWRPSDLVLPASERLASYFTSSAWRARVNKSAERLLDAGLHLA